METAVSIGTESYFLFSVCFCALLLLLVTLSLLVLSTRASLCLNANGASDWDITVFFCTRCHGAEAVFGIQATVEY